MKRLILLACLIVTGCSRSREPVVLRHKPSPLVQAVQKQDLYEVRHLLASHVEANEHVSPYDSALATAIRMKQYDIVEELIKGGADPRTLLDGDGPLETAAANEDLRMIKLLLSQKADPNRSGSGTPAIVRAAEQGSREILDELLRAGADVNDQDPEGKTALIEASQKGNLEMARYLISKGADPNLASQRGPALLVAEHEWEHKNPDLIAYLKTVAKEVHEPFVGGFDQEAFFKSHRNRRPTRQ